ncbi:MAG: LacI family transcriptional regulator [Lachnospiraceae bacterium]|nr:LacI family transcriptional regulator [Lachnospiraceae bacterium]
MRTTIKDVAKLAGVSLTTVSHALNGYKDVSEQTRQRVLEAAKQLDYAPDENARALGGRPSQTIALMLAGGLNNTDESGMIFGLISGIYSVAQTTQYDFMILTASREMQSEQSFVRQCRQKMVDGIIVFGLAVDMLYYEQIKECGIPCILVDVDLPGDTNRMVSVDNERAAYEEVSHMFDQGYRNIAVLNGRPEAQVCSRRLMGYQRALAERGLPVRPEWNVYTEYDEGKTANAVRDLTARYPEIDAFFCASDAVAIAATSAVAEMGLRVPEDIGMAGFDDFPVSKYFHGGITTVTQIPYEMGRTCADTLIALIEGRDVPRWIEVDYILQKRHSTAGSEIIN